MDISKKIAIIGSRTFNDYELLVSTMESYKDYISVIVSGGAKGADSLGERWAKENNIETDIYYPDWDKYGKKAGFLRNKQIVENSDGVIAFWDGESKGTQHSFRLCDELEIPIKIVKFSV